MKKDLSVEDIARIVYESCAWYIMAIPMKKDLSVEDIARIVYDAQLAYRIALNETPLGLWEIEREAVMHSVETVLANPYSSDRHLHEEWCKEKSAGGWVYNPKRNDVQKQHPCLLSFDKLSQKDRLQYSLQLAIIRTLTTTK